MQYSEFLLLRTLVFVKTYLEFVDMNIFKNYAQLNLILT